MNINVLNEDNHLLVVEKPVNIPVQADDSADKDLLTMAKEYIKINENKPGNVYLGLVHRLDRPVGGVMVFAKTSKAASRLSDQLRLNKIERQYLAVVRGTPEKKSGQLVDYLYKDRNKNQSYVVNSNHKEAKKAVLDYQVLAQVDDLSLVQVKLHTGRSHQIRVQLNHHGMPLYGDQKYASQLNKPGQQIALWATFLTLEHPTLKEKMNFTCLPPNDYPWRLFEDAYQKNML